MLVNLSHPDECHWRLTRACAFVFAGMAAMVPYGQPMAMMPSSGMYDGVMGGLRAELPASPGRAANGAEPHSWRPHRTGRGVGDRNYDPAQVSSTLGSHREKRRRYWTSLNLR